jgi:hypothetical protein
MRVIGLGSLSASGNAAAKKPYDNYVDEKVGVFQVDFTGASPSMTVELQGRLNDQVSYTQIAVITTADAVKAKSVVIVPDMRMSVTTYSAGTVTGYLGV